MQYMIIDESGSPSFVWWKLQQQVNKMLEQGWSLQGSPSTVMTSRGDVYMYQAIVKVTKK